MAEIRPRLLLGGVGPEEERETLPWLRRFPMEEKIGEQRRGASGLEWRKKSLTIAQLELSEETDVQDWCFRANGLPQCANPNPPVVGPSQGTRRPLYRC